MSEAHSPGERLGRFELRSELGRGAFGTVYRAYDPALGRDVALKRMHELSPDAIYDLKREFRSVAEIRHPGLVTLHELFIEDGLAWFSMELIDGADFVSWLRADAAEGQVISEDRLGEAAAQLVDALRALHESGRLHRDLKPENILVTREGRVVLADFGLVELPPHDPYADEWSGFAGTIAYMAPEILVLGEAATPASDWYAVGIVLYAAATGRLPYAPNEIFAKQKGRFEPLEGFSLPLTRVIHALLAPAPTSRPDGEELARILGEPAHRELTGASALRFSEVPFVARTQELGALEAACASSDLTVVFVSGPSGIGKSRLLTQFVAERPEGEVVLQARCRPNESVVYQALDGAIDGLVRHLSKLSEEELVRLVPNPEPALGRVFPVLQRLPMFSSGDAEPRELEPHELRRRAMGSLRQLLTAVARETPLLLWIDDAHWGDRGSAALLRGVLATSPPPLRLVLSFRSDEREESEFLRELEAVLADANVEELRIEPLDDSAVEGLCARLLADEDDADRRTLTEIVKRAAEGVPLLVARMCGMLEKGRGDVDVAASWSSLSEIVAAGIAQLPAGASSMLKLLALAEGPVPRRVLVEQMADDEAELFLTALHRDRWVRPARIDGLPAVEAYHDRIREAAGAGIDPPARRSGHLALAEGLQAVGAAPRTLVRHFLAGGRPEEGARYAALAARRAMGSLDFDGAAHFFGLAVEHGKWDRKEELSLRTGGAEAWGNAGQGHRAASAWLAVAARSTTDAASQCERRAAALLLGSGHLEEGYAVLEGVLRRHGLRVPASTGELVLKLAVARQRAGMAVWLGGRRHHRASASELELVDVCWDAAAMLSMVDTVRGAYFQALNVAASLRSNDPYRIGRALGLEVAYRVATGWHIDAMTQRMAERAEREADRGGEAYGKAIARAGRGMKAFMEGSWRSSVATGQEAMRLYRAECFGVWFERATAAMYEIFALLHLGELERARRMTDEWVAHAIDRNDVFIYSSYATTALPRLLIMADEVDRAEATVDEAVRRWSDVRFFPQHFWAGHARTSVALYRGDADAAWESLESWVPQLRGSMLALFLEIRVAALIARARVMLMNAAGERRGEAVGSARRLIWSLRAERAPWIGNTARALQATLDMTSHRQRSIEDLQRCAERFDALDMPIDAAVCRWRAGDGMAGARGERVKRAAAAALQSRGVARPDALAQAWLPLPRVRSTRAC